MSLFGRRDRPALIGVVHLLPLPGSPWPGPGLDKVLCRARDDAKVLQRGGVDGIIVENLGDAPFAKCDVAPWTIAAMTRCALAVREEAPDVALGINVLRNDASGALGIAVVVEANFIRVNVHIGAMITDQGWIEGDARQTLLARRSLGAEHIAIAADVMVKHAVSPAPMNLGQVAKDTCLRGGADALIVSGSGTGQPTDPADLGVVRAAVHNTPIWIGSGLTPATAMHIRADAAIVGTWLHEEADLRRPLDLARVVAMRKAL